MADVNSTLLAILQKLTDNQLEIGNRLNEIAQRLQALVTNTNTANTTLGNIDGRIRTLLPSIITEVTETNDHLINISSYTDETRGTVDLILANLSQNAQNAQNIALGTVGSCCGEPDWTSERSPELCARLGAVLAHIFVALANLSDFAESNVLPTVQQIVDRFRFENFGVNVESFLTRQEAAEMLAVISQRGLPWLVNLKDLALDQIRQDEIRTILFAFGTAREASNGLQYLATMLPTLDYRIAEFIRLALPPSLINRIWNPASNLSGLTWPNDACEADPDPDPPEISCRQSPWAIGAEGAKSLTGGFTISPEATGGVGDTFSIKIDEWQLGNPRNVAVHSLPDEEDGGVLMNGNTISWVIKEGQTGWRMFTAGDGTEAVMVYTICVAFAD